MLNGICDDSRFTIPSVRTDASYGTLKIRYSAKITKISTLPDLGAGSLVACPHGVVRPQQTGVTRLVRARERNQWSGGSASATGDRDLSTGQIDLGSADTLCLMQRDALDSDEIVAARKRLGDLEADLRLLCDDKLVSDWTVSPYNKGMYANSL